MTVEQRLRDLGVERISGALHAGGAVSVVVYLPAGEREHPTAVRPTTPITGQGDSIAGAVEDALGKVRR